MNLVGSETKQKNYVKNIYRLRDMTMFLNGNIGGFQQKVLKPIQMLFISIQNNQKNQLIRVHGTCPSTWQRLICANASYILCTYDTSVFLTHLASSLGGRFGKMSHPIKIFVC